ncbi:MAG: NTP transferase domain-containing protein, partial [Candidatus Eisenbacteria bacterium]
MRSEAASPSPDPKALGVLLAGGLGERLALGVPKAHAVLGGRTLFERALRALGGACTRLWVAAPAGMELPGVADDAPRFTRVNDVAVAGGPMAGIAAVADDATFHEVSSLAGARIVLLAVDQPGVTAEVIRKLLAAFDALASTPEAPPALIPRIGGMRQFFPMVLTPEAFSRFGAELRRGQDSMRGAAETTTAHVLEGSELDRLGIGDAIANDIDTPFDMLDYVLRTDWEEDPFASMTVDIRAEGRLDSIEGSLALGGVPLDRALAALRTAEPVARAAYVYDLDAVLTRATRLRDAFAAIKGSVAYAVKANALHALLEPLAALGIGGEAGSIGELEAVCDAGFAAGRRWLNGNGRTREEVEWVARNGVAAINADHVAELDLIERVAAAHDTRIRVALRVNPGIPAPVHRYISTGDDEAKFGVSPAEALEAWANRARWPHLTVDGIHLHIGSQLMDPAPLLAAFEAGLELIDVPARRGAPLALFNLGGGFGIDSAGGGHDFPLASYAKRLGLRLQGRGLELVVEPGRWVV